MRSPKQQQYCEWGAFDHVCWCVCRRAKRLRRILRQLESPAALAPLARFWRGTWGVVLVLLVAHIICYAVLSTVLDSRNR